MGHVLDRGDLLDVLEEAATFRRAVAVELKGGRTFVDQVDDVVTVAGEDWAVFHNHERVAVGDISSCARTDTPAPSYAGKT